MNNSIHAPGASLEAIKAARARRQALKQKPGAEAQGGEMIPHWKERIEYARDELAWLEAGAKEGEEPWREWDTWWTDKYGWQKLVKDPMWDDSNRYRRRPKMLHVIDAKGVRHEFPPPMREAPRRGQNYWAIMVDDGRIICSSWWDDPADEKRLKLGRCQSTEEGAQQQLAALRAACLGGEV